jgi:hypothetical protein
LSAMRSSTCRVGHAAFIMFQRIVVSIRYLHHFWVPSFRTKL